MVGLPGQVRPAAEDGVQRFGAFHRMQGERLHHRHRQGGDHAEGAEADPPVTEQRITGTDVTDGTVGGDQLHAAHHPGEPGETGAGAVGTGAHRPGERLRIHIALVGQGETVRGEQPGDVVQPGTGEEGDLHRRPVDAHEAAEMVEVEQDAVGDRRGGEGVPRPDRADVPPLLRGAPDGLLHLRDGAGLPAGDGVRGLRP
jgi:hypothetical protein